MRLRSVQLGLSIAVIVAGASCGSTAESGGSVALQVDAATSTTTVSMGSAESTASSSTAIKQPFPRRIDVGDHAVAIAEKPTRIAALSADVAEVALVLVGPGNLVALPDSNAHPSVGSMPSLAAEVENQLGYGEVVTKEQLESWDTDLVLISPNHAAEKVLSESLAGGSIPVLVMPNTWDTLADVRENIALIGSALGAEAEAQIIIADMSDREMAVEARLTEIQHKPVVMALTNVAQVPFLVGPGTSTEDLINKAAGANAADELGVTSPITGINSEQIVLANPDAILLVDGLGTGRDAFEELLGAPELSDVPAIANDAILVLPARDSFGTAHTLINGLEAIAEWLHPAA